MWFGTSIGIYNFDGISFRNFSPSVRKTSGVYWIREDSKGNIIYVDSENNFWKISNDSAHILPFSDIIQTYGKNIVIENFLVDSADNIWTTYKLSDTYFQIKPPYDKSSVVVQ